MITFVWLSEFPLRPGLGGTETYTISHAEELQRRGHKVQIATIGFGEDDGREHFPHLSFVSYTKKDLETRDETFVFVSEPMHVITKNTSYVLLHVPPRKTERRSYYLKGLAGKVPIGVSKFGAHMWEKYLKLPVDSLPVVYPFANPEFAKVKVEKNDEDVTRVLFAGRLSAEKGIYTLLTAMHLGFNRKMASFQVDHGHGRKYTFTATTSGDHTPEGKVIKQLLKTHPHIRLTPAKRNSVEMAELFARHDVVVMPSSHRFWKEMFGIVSVEAQHAGVRVVASDSGGIPETDCGGLILVKPDNPLDLASGLDKAGTLGRLTTKERRAAAKKFTLAHSVDLLVDVLESNPEDVVYTPAPTKPLSRIAQLTKRLKTLKANLF